MNSLAEIVEARCKVFDDEVDAANAHLEELMEEVDIREYVVSALPQIVVSDEVRAICEAELAAAAKRDYRII